jgi:Xaa-Pro aminopeptidase
MVKSAEEIRQLRFATAVSVNAHLAAWKRLARGVREFQLGATLVSVILENGCERPAYSPIVGSGPNTTILHYTRNRRQMDSGELVLMDAGAECGGYASDLTRTVPVSGKFTDRQQELYEVVLGAQKAAIAAVKPGMSLDRNSANSLFRIAQDYLDAHGRDRKGEPLGRYFTHAVGHHIGLEVHDAYDAAVALEPGMVITIEPGIYLPDEGIGIRIEDVVLVTDNGAEVLSRGLPKEVAAIERALAR